MGMDWAFCLQKEVNNKMSVDATVFVFPSLLQGHIFLPNAWEAPDVWDIHFVIQDITRS